MASPSGGGGATQPSTPPALPLDAPATTAALRRALHAGAGASDELASPSAPPPVSPSSPAWLDAAARAGVEGKSVDAATLLLASCPAAWAAPDPPTRRAACRLGIAAMKAQEASVAPAVAVLAGRGVALLDDDDGGVGRAALSLLTAAAAVLHTAPGQAWLLGLDTADRTEAAAVAVSAAAAIAVPPESVFADAGGDPSDTPSDAPAAAAWAARASACLSLASALAAGTARPGDAATTTAARSPRPPPLTPQPRLASSAGLWSVGDGTGGEKAAAAGLPTKSAPKGLIIEVLGGEEVEDGSGGEEEAAREKEEAASAAAATAAACAATDAAVATLLTASLYCGGEGLDGAWALPDVAGTATTALSPSFPLLFPLALRPLRATLVQAHWTGLDSVRMTAYEGPGVYERVLAGRQLAALVMREKEEALVGLAASSSLLPVVLAAADDPAPPVQRGGLRALGHLARSCPPSALASDRGILLSAAKKAVVGCDGRAWDVAAGAAVAVVVALDKGAQKAAPSSTFTPPPPAACLALLPDFLAEGERHAHERPRSLNWLAAVPPLLAGCGCGCLAVAPRLFPLLLRWLAAPDGGVREGAVRALATLLRATWPRGHAHAGHVWGHLAAARTGRPGDEPSAAEVQGLVECAAVVWAVGSEEFREEARKDDGVGGRALVAAVEER